MSLHGIDVSRWQGVIDWAKVVKSENFAIMKSTGGDQGLYVDPEYSRNIFRTRALKMRRGTYHYAGATDPVAEAKFYVEKTGRRDGELQVLDFEGAVLNVADPVGWALAWVREVHRLTRNRPLIYMSNATSQRFNWSRVVSANFGLWDASWGTVPPRPRWWKFFALWQRSATGRVSGISGDVDLDTFPFGTAAWDAYGRTEKAPAPAPAPAPVHRVYVVHQGDTFYSIAQKFHVSLSALIKANPKIKNPSLIFPGETVNIP